VVVVQWIPIVLGKKYKPLWVGGVCHIVAQSFLFNATTANVAIQNGGGCRVLMSAGNLTYGNAYMILSFANTLVTLIMTGDQIKLVLEDVAQSFIVLGGSGGAYPFAAGLRWSLNYSAPFGSRLDPIFVNKRLNDTWVPLDLAETYKVHSINLIIVYFFVIVSKANT
jgi:5'-nucleotidase / UDP-sugar diphosphatase